MSGTNEIQRSEIFIFLAFIFIFFAIFTGRKHRDYPPIISISEASGYSFMSGKDNIEPNFKLALETDLIDRIESQMEKCKCDAIEIVGHTDGQFISDSMNSSISKVPIKKTNLDSQLVHSIYRNEKLIAGSNVDLGMMRAVAVMKLLQKQQTDFGRLNKIKYWFPRSSGQLILPNNSLTNNNDRYNEVPERRRIEIQLFQFSSETYSGD